MSDQIEFKPIQGLNETSLNKLIEMSGKTYADKTYVDNAVNNVTVDTSNLVTKTELGVEVENYLNENPVSVDTSNLVTKTELGTEVKNYLVKNPVSADIDIQEEISKISNVSTLKGLVDRDLTPTVDTNGDKIHAHGCGIMKYGDTYYMYGEYKVGTTTNRRIPFNGIACYSSKDLVNWKFENKVIKPNTEDSTSDFYTNRIFERPKVIYNEKNNNFVLYVKMDNTLYSDSQFGVFTSNSPTAEFTFVKKFRPALDIPCRDMTLFVDDDKKGYVLCARTDNNSDLYIHELDEDYTGVTENYCIATTTKREAPCMAKYNGKYYLVTSGCTGWDPNPTEIHVADTILGTYKRLGTVCTGDTDNNSYGCQPTFILPLNKSVNGYPFLLCFDKWNPNDLESSTYLWLPMYYNPSINRLLVDKTNKTTVKVYIDNGIELTLTEGNFKGKTYKEAFEQLLSSYTTLASRVTALEGGSVIDPDAPLTIDKTSITTNLFDENILKASKTDASFIPSTTDIRVNYENGVAKIYAIKPVTDATITVTSGDETQICTINASQEDTVKSNYQVYLDATDHGSDNNVWTDLSGNGNDYVLTGFTHDASTNGWIDNELLFNGSSTYIANDNVKPLDAERNFVIDLTVKNKGVGTNAYILGYMVEASPYQGLKVGTAGSSGNTWVVSCGIDTNNRVASSTFTQSVDTEVNIKIIHINKHILILKDGETLKSGDIQEFMPISKNMLIGANINTSSVATAFSKIAVSKFTVKYL